MCCEPAGWRGSVEWAVVVVVVGGWRLGRSEGCEGWGFPLAVEGNTACGEAGMKEAVCVSHLFLPLVNKGF